MEKVERSNFCLQTQQTIYLLRTKILVNKKLQSVRHLHQDEHAQAA